MPGHGKSHIQAAAVRPAKGAKGSMTANASTTPKHGDRHLEGAMLLMVLATLILPGIDAIAKWLADTIPPGQIAWSRFLFQTLFMLPLFVRTRGRLFESGIWPHAVRGVLIGLATLVFFSALQYLPVADAISIFFVEPLLLTLLAAAFLGETIGWRRLIAVFVGLAGAILVIRPNFQAFGWAAALPLLAAVLFAAYLLVTRSLAQREHPARMQLYAGVFGCLTMSVGLIYGAAAQVQVLDPVWPSSVQWLWLAALGAIATTGHLLMVYAFQRAPAAVLAPFQYLEIVSATALGLLVFGDFPDPLTWLGVAIIVSSGIYVFRRERLAVARRRPGSRR